MSEWEGLLPETKWKPPQSKDGYTPQELVPILGSEHFSGKKVRRLIRNGRIKCSPKKWGHWHIDKAAVVAYIASEKKRQGLS